MSPHTPQVKQRVTLMFHKKLKCRRCRNILAMRAEDFIVIAPWDRCWMPEERERQTRRLRTATLLQHAESGHREPWDDDLPWLYGLDPPFRGAW